MDKNEKRNARISAMQDLYLMDMNNYNGEEDEYALSIINCYQENKEKVDELISSSLTNYKLERLPYVTRALIRVSVSEMLLGVPTPVAINEALEISKEYIDTGDKKDVRFINKVLDTIKNRM